jgi:aspartate aminotransferase
MTSEEEIRRHRENIRSVTLEILRGVALRRELAKKLGEAKKALGLSLVDHEAELELRQHIARSASELGLDPSQAQRILTLLIEDALKIQSPPAKPRITHMDIFRKAKQIEMSGEKVYHLEVGEPDFGAPTSVADELTWAALNGYAAYGEAKGRPELRRAVRDALRERLGIDAHEDQIVITPGGRFAVYAATAAILSPGDQALVIDPSWPLYKQVIEMMHARPIVLKTSLEEGWRPRIEELEKRLSQGCRALFINYPNNPTGTVLGRSELSKIAQAAKKAGAYLISDEVYMDYCFTDYASALETGYENIIMINSFSKSWGMTGYRIGYLLASREIADRAARIVSQLITCVPEFIQMAALKAIRDGETPKKYGQVIRERIDLICRELDRAGARYVRPTGAMYVFPQIGDGDLDSAELALKLLEKRRVAVAPGTAFGDYPAFIRISAGTSKEDLLAGIRLLLEELEEKRSSRTIQA